MLSLFVKTTRGQPLSYERGETKQFICTFSYLYSFNIYMTIFFAYIHDLISNATELYLYIQYRNDFKMVNRQLCWNISQLIMDGYRSSRDSVFWLLTVVFLRQFYWNFLTIDQMNQVFVSRLLSIFHLILCITISLYPNSNIQQLLH